MRSSNIQPSRDSFRNGSYPLNRSVYLFINRNPGKPADPKVDEFICYVLSREGQQIVSESNIYFALSPAMEREHLVKLD